MHNLATEKNMENVTATLPGEEQVPEQFNFIWDSIGPDPVPATQPADHASTAEAATPAEQRAADPVIAHTADFAEVADSAFVSIAGSPADAIVPDVGTGPDKEDADPGVSPGPILPGSSVQIETELEPMDLQIDWDRIVVDSGVIPPFPIPTPLVDAVATQKPRYMLPAPTPVLMLAIQPSGSDRSSGDGAPDSGARRHCFAARRHHSYPHAIREISSLMDPGESRLYNVLLDLCGIDLLTSLTMRRDEPFEVTVGRSVLIERVLQIKFTQPELEAIGSDKKRKSRETENARTEIKNATKGLTAKRFIECIHPAGQPYIDRITYRVFISHQVLSRLSEIGTSYWRASGPGRILVDSNGEDIRIQTPDHGASKHE